MFTGTELQQLYLLLILVGTVILLFTEWIRLDLTAILIIVALSMTRVLEPQDALSGFSSEPAILVATVFVMNGALYHTGLSGQLGNWIKRLAGNTLEQMNGAIMSSVALLSAFTHHVTITAIMLPPILKLSRENNIPASRLLMPMSFAASLGTTITIIGAPAFLIVDGLLKQSGQEGLGIFSIAPIGLVLSLAGTVFIVVLGRVLLPAHPGDDEAVDNFRLDGYYTELVILVDSVLIGKTISQIEEMQSTDFQVLAWYRDDHPRNKPFGNKKTQAEDVLLVRTNPDRIATIQQEPGIALRPLQKYEKEFVDFQEKEDDWEQLYSSMVQ